MLKQILKLRKLKSKYQKPLLKNVKNFFLKIFNNIYTIQYCKLFLLAWYNDQIYDSTIPNITIKLLQILYYNGTKY